MFFYSLRSTLFLHVRSLISASHSQRPLQPIEWLGVSKTKVRSCQRDRSRERHALADARINVNPCCFKEQDNATSPLHSPSTATATMFDNHDDSNNRMDTIDLRQIVEDRDNENIFSTMDRSTHEADDDYSSDHIDAGHAQASRSPLDEHVDTNSPTQSSPNSHTYRQRASPTGEQRDSPEQDVGEETRQTSSRSPPPWSSSTTATTELPTDNENLSIR